MDRRARIWRRLTPRAPVHSAQSWSLPLRDSGAGCRRLRIQPVPLWPAKILTMALLGASGAACGAETFTCPSVERGTPFSVTVLEESPDSTSCQRLPIQAGTIFDIDAGFYLQGVTNDDCPPVPAEAPPSLEQTTYEYSDCFPTLDPLGIRCLVRYTELCDSTESGGWIRFAFSHIPRGSATMLETDFWITDTPGRECYMSVPACRDHFLVTVERRDP